MRLNNWRNLALSLEQLMKGNEKLLQCILVFIAFMSTNHPKKKKKTQYAIFGKDQNDRNNLKWVFNAPITGISP